MYHDVESVMEVCAVIIHPEKNCPVQFYFSVTLSNSDGKLLNVLLYYGLCLAILSDSDPTINFAECEERSCVNISRASFPAFLARTPGLDPRITLCPETAKVFSGMKEEASHYTKT